MNLKRTFVTAVAAVGLMASIAAPIASAQPVESPGDNTTVVSVAVSVTGEFDVYFWTGAFNLSGAALTAASPESTSTGKMRIQYTDTLPSRPNFDVTVVSGNFTSGSNSISRDNFTITGTYNVVQGQFGGPTSSTPGSELYDVGDIGYFVNQDYPTTGQANFTEWDSDNVLNNWVKVQFGYAGVGTIGSYGDVDLALKIPSTTVAGNYSATMTLNVVAGTQP